MDAANPLIIVGAPDAAACEGDVCDVPEHHGPATVNERLDHDAV